MEMTMLRVGVREAGNAGLVTTSGGGVWNLLHSISTVTLQQVTFGRPYVVRKIMWYNPGADATLQIGTQSGTPAFVPLLPTILAPAGITGTLTEAQIPAVMFESTTNVAAAAAQRNGNCYVLASAGGIIITIEVEKFGA